MKGEISRLRFAPLEMTGRETRSARDDGQGNSLCSVGIKPSGPQPSWDSTVHTASTLRTSSVTASFTYQERQLNMDTQFIEDLASAAPTPGGGGASAYVGALASALASMVGNLTVGKKTYADVEADVYIALEKLAIYRERLLELVGEDAHAFEPLAHAYKMPKATPEEQEAKEAALQEALYYACDVPLSIMETIKDVVDVTEFLAQKGSRMALSDAGVAAAFARGAVQGASLNIFINAASINDATQAKEYRRKTEALSEVVVLKCDEIFAYVKERVCEENAD